MNGAGVRTDGERELVREAADRVLAGQGLMTIARDWNQRGVPGVTECPWTAPTLRRVLLSARVAGLREHGADPSGKVLGALTAAVWKGAIDRQRWDHVRSVLLNPERLTLRNTPTKYVLTGLIFCGVCGGRMLSRPRDTHTRQYVCAGRRAGHQLAILAQPADELVANRVLDLLTTPSFREAVVRGSARHDDGAVAQALRRARLSSESTSDAGRRLLRPRSARPASLPLYQDPTGKRGRTTPRAGRRSWQAADRPAP